MRFIRLLFKNSPIRNAVRLNAAQTRNVPFVRVLSSLDEDSIKLSFSNSSALSIKAPKDQDVSSVLSMIRLKFALHRKREEMKQAIVRKYSNTVHTTVETAEDSEDVYLIENNRLIEEGIPNIEAWSQASILKIGDTSYEIHFNTPFVKSLLLPDYVVVGCITRPHIILECASLEDCIFSWYRSVNNGVNNVNSVSEDWVKIGEGFHYMTTIAEVGCFLKVVCSPRYGNRIGLDFTTISKNIVESGPEVFPFEERHIYTEAICNNDRIRCVSYNTLASMYVEKRKFPYASEKARDSYYRKQLLIRELLGYNSDIICLQEVQERVFEYDLLPVFKKFDFHGFYMRKGGKRYEGLATFVRSSKFRVIFNKGILLNEVVKEKNIFSDLLTKVSGNYKDMSKLLAQDTALQTVLLENVHNPANKLLIANTHLYSNKDTPEVRLIQSALCVYYLEHLIKDQLLDSTGMLFCGDFNSLPDSEAYSFITTGNFQCCPSWKSTNMNSIKDTTLRHTLNLESACGIPAYTNFTEEFQGCLDYIFYNKNSLEVTDIVPMPSHEKVSSQIGLPNEYFPSDHIALVCTLKWKNKIS